MPEADIVELPVVAAFINYQSPAVNTFRGIFSQAPEDLTGGNWRLRLSQALHVGEWGARFASLNGTASVTWGISDGDDLNKFLHIEIGGVGGTPNGFSLELYRLVPPR